MPGQSLPSEMGIEAAQSPLSTLPTGDTKYDVEQLDDLHSGKEMWNQVKVQAEDDEAYMHSLPLWQAIKTYRKAIGWSLLASSCVIMDGYDTMLLGSSYALGPFQQKFGTLINGKHQIPAKWQAGCSQAANVGQIIGSLLGAYLVDKIGYRRTLQAALIYIIPFIGMATFAPNLPVLLVAELLCGISWGSFSTLGPGYASEVCPMAVRAYLTTYTNLCWVFGHFIGAAVLLGTHNIKSVYSYRIPFMIQWAWPIPIAGLLFLAPESPWWYVRHNRLREAEDSVNRLSSSSGADPTRVANTVAGMVRTNQLEKDVQEGTGFLDLFKGSDRRRTEITCVIWTSQVLTGLGWSGYSTYFYQQAGLSTDYAFAFTMLGYGIGGIATICSWFLLTHVGRRKIIIYGLICLGLGMLIIGILGVVADHGNKGARWGQASMMLVWLFNLQFTIGSLAYCIIGETSSTRLRTKTIGLGRVSYNIFAIGFGIMTPYMINPTAFNWGGKAGFFWAPLNLICATWAFFRLPEMKDRSNYELDVLFERGVPARKFKSTVVEPYADEHVRAVAH